MKNSKAEWFQPQIFRTRSDLIKPVKVSTPPHQPPIPLCQSAGEPWACLTSSCPAFIHIEQITNLVFLDFKWHCGDRGGYSPCVQYLWLEITNHSSDRKRRESRRKTKISIQNKCKRGFSMYACCKWLTM